MDLGTILANPIVEVALIFVDGLLFGLGIKKGVWSVLLIIIAVALGEYINYSVVPKTSLSTFEADVKDHIMYVISNIEKVIPAHSIGSIGAIGVSFIVFGVGFVIGYLKG